MIVLSPALAHLREYLEVARAGSDPEGVHQVRVATRQIRVWLDLGHYLVLQDDVAWLGKNLGKVRDLEVLLQKTDLPKGFYTWIEHHLAEIRPALTEVLYSRRLDALLKALEVLPPLEPKTAKQSLARLEQQLRQRGWVWETKDSLEQLHALRRTLRKLRYARDWLERDTRVIRKLQGSFGAVGDWVFTKSFLTQFVADGGKGVAGFEKKLDTQLQTALLEAHLEWKKAKPDLFK